MCGIVGAVAQRDVSEILLEGLRRLEYRGYDSAGLAILSLTKELHRIRALGKVEALTNAVNNANVQGHIGIAHTRWATHGIPSERNAHPHVSGNIVIVHNGIIENYAELKQEFLVDCTFNSDTDTEVIAHLINLEQKNYPSLTETVCNVVKKLKGAYGMVIMDTNNPDELIAARSGSPLVLGLGVGENFIASDQLALLPVTNKFIFLEEGDIATIAKTSIYIQDNTGKEINRKVIESNAKYDAGDKGQYRHYMQKEIYEQPNAIKNSLIGRLDGDHVSLSELGEKGDQILNQIEHVQIVACGTAYNAGFVAKYWFESLLGLPCDVEIASEYRYRNPAPRKNSLFIALSQSGETADTLAALRLSKELGCISSLAICNVATSTLVRESEMVLLTKAGTEIGVASTKAFTTQLTVLLLIVARIATLKNKIKLAEQISHALQILPNKIEQVLTFDKAIQNIAEDFSNKHHSLFLGRGSQYPIAMEAALKLKEISYIHAEAYAAGELKHGPLALVDEDMPVIIMAPDNDLLEKLKANIEEVKARGGLLYVFTAENSGFVSDTNTKIIELPEIDDITAPIYYTVPTQLLAYYVAIIKGTDVDQPRNLAKSVTVE